ncbi:MAG: putative DNA-binding domain-containing protein [Gammaproteobacteria bacterium]|nr:putative DNA-binding domain-containing protein [Gammaproteobacteria bacterium]
MSVTADLPRFQQLQRDFAAHVRDPESHPAPADVEPRRMAIYRTLFYNNVEGLLASNFPVLRAVTPDERWHALVRAFYRGHRCETPYFPRIAEEFLNYLENERAELPGDPPFMRELAHYEWVELALLIADDPESDPLLDPNADLLQHPPVLSPLAWRLAYRYPVHQIRADQLLDSEPIQVTTLAAYRNRQDKVGFLETSPVVDRLLVLVGEQPSLNGQQLLEQIAAELNHPEVGQFVIAGAAALQRLLDLEIVLGGRVSG